MLKGKWRVKYIPETFDYRQVLQILVEIDNWRKTNYPEVQSVQILFDKQFKENCFYLKEKETPDHFPILNIKLKNGDIKKLKNKKDCFFDDIQLISKTKIKKILLCFPVIPNDKRWKTIHLTASSIFLGSSLCKKKYHVEIKKLAFPYSSEEKEMLNYDVLGFTLFEDLFKEIKDVLSQLRAVSIQGQPLFAAGGPLATLNPLGTVFHMPELNLLVRGEAELVFHEILDALEKNNIDKLFENQGFFYQIPGLIFISDLDVINRPVQFKNFDFNFKFIEKDHIKSGLEINFSRGCKRKCMFCCKVQGSKLRKLPLEKVDDLLKKFSSRLDDFDLHHEFSKSININDDDILQDTTYAKEVFGRIKKYKFKIWGIQCSINSFFNNSTADHQKIFNMIGDRELYVENNPLIWIGTDVFLKKRGKRLGKKIIDKALFIQLIERFERDRIRNFHYWISSDYLSSWEEFVEEFIFIYELKKRFKMFSILAHAPFLIPYSTTPLFKLLDLSADHKNQIKYKQVLKSNQKTFHLQVAQHVETKYLYLNQLLNNEKMDNGDGFFDFLNRNDFPNTFKTMYNFLKRERISLESSSIKSVTGIFKKLEKKIEGIVSELI